MKKKYKFINGTEIPCDPGDLTAIIELLYNEVAIKKKMNYSFNDMKKEIENLINQMPEKERKMLMTESIFLNTIIYENQMMEKVLKKYNS